MLARYRQTPVEEGDKAILNKHPMVALWQEVVPYLLEYNPRYRSLFDNTEYWQKQAGQLYWIKQTKFVLSLDSSRV